MYMNSKMQLLLAVVGGVVIGAFGVGLAWAKAKPPAYMVVEYEITDDAGFDEFIKGDEKIQSPRIFLARHAKGVSLSGEPPKWIGILQFPSVEDALAFDSSPEFTALKPIRDKSTKWRSFVVKGLGN
jgi:uncharacterized protein (DUF1330 family)